MAVIRRSLGSGGRDEIAQVGAGRGVAERAGWKRLGRRVHGFLLAAVVGETERRPSTEPSVEERVRVHARRQKTSARRRAILRVRAEGAAGRGRELEVGKGGREAQGRRSCRRYGRSHGRGGRRDRCREGCRYACRGGRSGAGSETHLDVGLVPGGGRGWEPEA